MKGVSQTVNSVTFETTDPKTFVLGMVAGLQFTADTYGKCFYAMVDTVNYVNFFVADWNKMLTEYNFYSVFVYDTIHFYGNTIAVYE